MFRIWDWVVSILVLPPWHITVWITISLTLVSVVEHINLLLLLIETLLLRAVDQFPRPLTAIIIVLFFLGCTTPIIALRMLLLAWVYCSWSCSINRRVILIPVVGVVLWGGRLYSVGWHYLHLLVLMECFTVWYVAADIRAWINIRIRGKLEILQLRLNMIKLWHFATIVVKHVLGALTL